MKKNRIAPEEALKFLENMRTLNKKIDGPKKPISIRIPENILEAIKIKANLENRKYQNLIVDIVREYLVNN